MKILLFAALAVFASCNNANQSLVKEHLTTSMKLPESNLEIDKVEIGEEVQAKPEQKQSLALLGLKDMNGFPLIVTFKAKSDCVAIAEAIKNDVLFNEKKVSCRSIKNGEKPDLKFVKSYKITGFGKQVPIYEDGKLIKAGDTFSAKGELVFMTNFKDEKKSGTVFQGLN